MNSPMKIFWLIGLMFFVTGCGGYRMAGHSLPEVTEEMDSEVGGNSNVNAGDKVRIEQVDGERVMGIVHSVSPRDIVLETTEMDGRVLTIPAGLIQSIEISTSSNSDLVWAAVGVGVLLAMVMVVMDMDIGIEEMDWDWGDGGIVY